ncbi:GDSL-type esterase/lipase family protein [Mucilaginibacter lacusdianchii]|uniref:GDSL-type esterase/lipase family protein n=1 Tax=Mucilaginibacter lacusdianchii TaxID=2684211 RepID=UPI00131DAE94|nr:GDSL-type esterase/lipase family protein [Mucilaginibacter sp. JXJ CY 39]
MKKLLGLCLLLVAFYLPVSAQYSFPFGNEIKVFKQQDSVNFPKPKGVLFVGSSSIRLWDDLEHRFAAYPVIKRGVGGSKLHEWVQYYMPYILYPYKPAKIFIYAGENDIADGIPASQVAQDFAALCQMIRKKLPKANVYFLSIKQSPSRAKYYSEVTLANQQIKQFIKGKRRTYFIDVNTPLFNSQTQQPDSAYFKSDYLHLKPNGYDRWEEVLRNYIK